MGVQDDPTRKKLLQVLKLTLGQCVDICRAYEKTTRQLESKKTEEVMALEKQTHKQSENPRKQADVEVTIRRK